MSLLSHTLRGKFSKSDQKKKKTERMAKMNSFCEWKFSGILNESKVTRLICPITKRSGKESKCGEELSREKQWWKNFNDFYRWNEF